MTNYVDAVGVAARFGNFIQGLAWEPGFVYVADGSNSQVRRFEVSTGRVTSVLGIPGRIGVRLGALPTSVARPDMLLSIGPGDLLLRDENSLLRARLRCLVASLDNTGSPARNPHRSRSTAIRG